MTFIKLNIKNFLLAIISLVSISCTEIIDINTIETNPQTVVEASIGLNEFATVWLTKSINLKDTTNNFPRIKDAKITLSDNQGNTEILQESSLTGNYKSTKIKGENGKTYSISIKAENIAINSISTIPTFVPIDSFKVENSIYPGGGKPITPNQEANFYEVRVKFSDPVNEKNYYRCVLFLNDKPNGGTSVYEDRLTNGKIMEAFMIIFNPLMKTGDKISVEFQCIDKSVYEYFNSMGNSTMGPRNASSPANPYTNLTGSLLGYFSAHTVERREYIVP